MNIKTIADIIPEYQSSALLTNDGTDLEWTDSPTITSLTLTGLDAGGVVYVNASDELATDTGLTWNDSDDFMTITSTAGKQLRLAYDGVKYCDFTKSSGSFTIAPSNGTVTIADNLSCVGISASGSATFDSTVYIPTTLLEDKLITLDSDGSLIPITDLTSWIAGTANQITVTDDTDGTVTLSTPQDIATTSTPQFARLGIGAAADATIPLTVSDTGSDGQISLVNSSEVINIRCSGSGNLEFRLVDNTSGHGNFISYDNIYPGVKTFRFWNPYYAVSDTGSVRQQMIVGPNDANAADAGDPYLNFSINSICGYALGIDNSDSDKFKLTYDSPTNPSPSVGTEFLVVDTSGNFDFKSGNITTVGYIRSESNASVGALTYPAMIEVASDATYKIGNSYAAGINAVCYFNAADLNSSVSSAALFFQEASGTQPDANTYAGIYGGANIDVDSTNYSLYTAGLWFSVSNAGTINGTGKLGTYNIYGVYVENNTWDGGTVSGTSTCEATGIKSLLTIDGTYSSTTAGSIYGIKNTITDSIAGTGTLTVYGDYLEVPATSAILTTVWGYYCASDVPSYFGGEIEIEGDLNHDGSNVGFMGVAPQAQQAHIVDADGTLADITTKFNTLLADLEGYGLLASA